MANSNGWGDGASNNSIGWGQGANNAIAWGDSHAKSWAGATDIVGIDAASSAFFSATGITGTTQQAAIDNLVKGLKADGLWSKMKAVYPFVTDNRNLLDYTEDFSNGTFWPRGGTSITTNTTTAPNGTLTADKISEDTTNAAHYVSFQTGKMTTTSSYTMSAYLKAGERTWAGVYLYNGSSPLIAFFNLSAGTIGNVDAGATATITDAGNGWYRCTVSSTLTGSSGNNGGILCASSNGTWIYTGTTGNGIYAWGAQLELGSTATTYQPIATTTQAYISSQFKYNLVNPVDSDAAFRLVFNGGWTHSSNGATPNGTNGYADTKFIPSSNFTSNNNISLGYYTRNFASGGITLTGEMGSANSGLGNGVYLIIYYNVTGQSVNRVASNTSQLFSISPIAGFYSLSRTTSANFKYFRNNILLDTPAITSSGRTSNSMWIGGVNYGTSAEYGQGQCAFSFIGDGLTDTEAANLYSRVQTYQNSLNRAI